MPEYSEKLKKYVEEAKKSFATSIDERVKRLAKEERESQLYGAEKLQQAGRFTSGFRTDLLTRVMDMFAGRRGEMRGGFDERALAAALQMLGLSEQAEQAGLERTSREALTREGYALQKYLANLSGRGGGGGGRVSTSAYRPTTTSTRTTTPTRTVAPKRTTKTDYEKKKSDYYYKKYATTYPQYKKPVTGKTYDWRTEMAIPRTYGGRGGKIY